MKADVSKKRPLEDRSRKKKKKKKKLNTAIHRRFSSSSSYSSDSVEKSHNQKKRQLGHGTKRKPGRSSENKRSKGSRKLSRRGYRSSSPSTRSSSCSTCCISDVSCSPDPPGRRAKESVARTRRRRSCSTCSGYYTANSDSSSHDNQSTKDKYFRGRDRDPSLKQKANRNSRGMKTCQQLEPKEGKIEVKKKNPDDRDIHMNNATDTRAHTAAFDKGNDMVLPANCDQRWPANSLDRDINGTREGSIGKRKRGDVDSSGLSCADDLEMILRQKALENFKKYQIQNSIDNKSIALCKNESLQNNSCQDLGKTPAMEKRRQEVKNNVALCIANPSNSFEGQIPGTKGIYVPRVSRVSSVVVSREENVKNASPSVANQNGSHKTLLCKPDTVGGSSVASSTARPNPVTGEPSDKRSANQELLAKDVNDMVQSAELEYSNRASSEQVLLEKDTHGKKVLIDNTGKQKNVDEDKKTEGSIHSFQNPQPPTCSPIEPTTGSQFEEKTFSRMHQGEVVQVSYKVYIPKRSATLARRKLQR